MDIDTTLAWIRAIAAAIDEHADELTRMDAAIGDGDHGVNMRRGFSAVLAVVERMRFNTIGELLLRTGTTLVSTVGGASGPLYGAALRAAGKRLDAPEATPEQLLEALTAGMAAMQRLGGAKPGDKTIIDACAPALEALRKALDDGEDLPTAARAAADAAEEGMRATIPMIARRGRASYLGPRSQGYQDPGATSTALMFRALAQVADG